jgi:hypothetical protein
MLMPQGFICLVFVDLVLKESSLEHGKEPLGPINGWKYLDLLHYHQLINDTAL